MLRLLFEKKGRSVWISHLDLMRLFQRAFKRAGLPLTHTQGFNPRPSVSIALPLSVGIESQCELLDFELEGVNVSCGDIMERLNSALIDGVHVKQVYEGGRKLKELCLLSCEIVLSYDDEMPDDALEDLQQLFKRDEVLVSKKTKNGIQEQNIIPMIPKIEISVQDKHHAFLYATVCCQNPSLNPMQLAAAVECYLPHLKPDHVCCSRVEIYDSENNVFR